jgi:membrane-associated protease RseP (regulator of RpoE activity)
MMNQSRIGQRVRELVVPLLVVTLAGSAWGQDSEKKAPAGPAQPAEQAKEASPAAASYWLGILAVPADAILKSHLRIEDGVVVEQVVPDSPAAKAGILVNDILLQFGEAKLTDVEGLQKAVAENKDREAKVALLRAGKQMTVNVKPEVMPADRGIGVPSHPGDWGRISEMLKKLERGDFGEDPLRMFFVQPGVVVPKELKQRRIELFTSPPDGLRLPKGTRITVTRQHEGPTKIVVEKDGQKWEVTENEMDKLPEDVQPAVKGMLGGGRVYVFGQGPVVVPGERPGRSGEGKASQAVPEKRPEGKPESAANERDKIREKMEEITRQQRENEKRMQKQLDELRQQVEKLGVQKI